MDEEQETLPTVLDNFRVEGLQGDSPLVAYSSSSTLTPRDTACHGDMAEIPVVYPGLYPAFYYLDKQELSSTPVRQRFFPRASRSVLKALLETPPMRIYSPDPSYGPCTRLARAVDSSTRVLETSFLAKRHGLDEWESSCLPAPPASLPNATPLPLRLSLLPSSSAANGFDLDPASPDSFALSLPASDAGSSPAVHMCTHTQSARAPRSNSESRSHSMSDPFVASRRSSRSHARPMLSARFTELFCPTVAVSAALFRPAEREGPPSLLSGHMPLSRPLPAYDPRRVMGSGVSVGTVERYQRVMRELQRQGLGDNHWHNRPRSASTGSGEDDSILNVDVEPPSPSPQPSRGDHSDAELELRLKSDLELELEPLDMTRGSPFSGSLAHYSYSYSHSQLAASVSDSDLGVAELELQALGLGHGHGRGSFRLPATASAPLLCSLGPDLGRDDSTHTHTHDVAEDTQRTSPGGFHFWQPRFSLHVAGDDSSCSSSSGSAAGDCASSMCASDGSCSQPSSTFAAMRRDFVALLSDQADEEEGQAMQLRANADRLEKRARSKRLLVDAIE